MNRSGKYELMKREYVLGDDTVTYASLGGKYGRVPGSIGVIAKKENWVGLRAQHRSEVANRVDDQMADELVGKIINLRSKFIDAAVKSVDRYVEAVDNREITPNATDIAKLASTVKELVTRAESSDSPEGNGDGIRISEALGRDFFRALEATARAKSAAGPVEKPAIPQLVSSG